MWLQGYDVSRCKACDWCGLLYLSSFFIVFVMSLSLHLSSTYKVMIRQSADVAPGL